MAGAMPAAPMSGTMFRHIVARLASPVLVPTKTVNVMSGTSEQKPAADEGSKASSPTVAAATGRGTRPTEVTREALYELVWTDPLLRIGSRFGVSATYLARVCDELRVPRPPNGYWAQLEFGKAPPKPPLPEARAGEQTSWKPGVAVTAGYARASRKKVAAAVPLPSVSAPRKPVRSEPRKQPAIIKCHELLEGVKPYFLKTRGNDAGLLRPFKRMLVDVITSAAQLDAAIESANTLFQAFEARGHRVALATPGSNMRRAEVDEREVRPKSHYPHPSPWAPDRPTVVWVNGVPIGLTMFETTEVVKMIYVGNDNYVPLAELSEVERRRHEKLGHWTSQKERTSGRFRLQAYCPTWYLEWKKEWTAPSAAALAQLAESILRDLEAEAPEVHRQVAEAKAKADAQHLKWKEEERLRRAAEERARQEKARKEARERLLAAIAAWDEARRVQDWLNEVARDAERLPEYERAEIARRLAEARTLIGKVDALELLKHWNLPDC